jgi:UPF0755 protein
MKILLKIFLLSFIGIIFYVGNVVFFPHEIPNNNYELIINKEESLKGVAESLKRDGLISSPEIFLSVIRLMNKDTHITAGLYVLKDSISMWDLVKKISNGKPDEILLTIIDGWKIENIRNYIDNFPHIQHLTQNLSNDELKHLLNIPWPSLEGAFYPTTYYVAPNETDLEIYRSAYAMLQSKLNEVYSKRGSNVATSSPYGLLIMASLVEKETANISDMYLISTVFNNRLRLDMRLQTDPAVFYGLQNKKRITREDFKIDTKYNTYLHAGLPPTPICSPSLLALKAAANPKNDSKVLYFVAVGDGRRTRFSNSFSVHSHWVARFIEKQSNSNKVNSLKGHNFKIASNS